MTYNLTALENTTGIEALIGLNRAADFIPMTIFILVVVGLIFSLVRRDHDAPEAMLASSLVFVVICAGFYTMGMIGQFLLDISIGLAALALFFHFQRGQPHTT